MDDFRGLRIEGKRPQARVAAPPMLETIIYHMHYVKLFYTEPAIRYIISYDMSSYAVLAFFLFRRAWPRRRCGCAWPPPVATRRRSSRSADTCRNVADFHSDGEIANPGWTG